MGILVGALALGFSENHAGAVGHASIRFVKGRTLMLLWVAASFVGEVKERKVQVRWAVDLQGTDTEQAPVIKAWPDAKRILNKANVGFVLNQLPARAGANSLRRRVIETRGGDPAQDLELIARWEDGFHKSLSGNLIPLLDGPACV